MVAKQVPGSRGLLVAILLADSLNNLIQGSIVVANGNIHTSAMASAVACVLLAVLFFGVLAIIHFVYLCVIEHKITSYILALIQTIGAIFYYYGDNIPNILSRYGQVLGCGPECQKHNSVASVFSLGLALVIFKIFPPMLQKFFKLIKKQKEKPKGSWFHSIDMICLIVKVDILYSAVVAMVDKSESCSETNIGVSLSLMTLCIVTGLIAEVIFCAFALTTCDKNEGHRLFKAITVITFISVIFSFPMYILADNVQPLDCAFECDSLSTNTTSHCNLYIEAGIRLGFNSFVFVTISTLSLVLFSCNAREKRRQSHMTLLEQNDTELKKNYSK